MELEHRVAVSVCKSVVCDLLHGIRTPERPGSPAELYTTEEEQFHAQNPNVGPHKTTLLWVLTKQITTLI